MAELKTKPTAVSVESFLDKVADAQQREDSFKVLAMMKEITGLKPKMWGPSIIGFGEYHYKYASGHEGDCCLTGFSPRKGSLSLYIMPGFERYTHLLKRLGKHKTGKSCLYVKRLADIDVAVLREMIETGLRDMVPERPCGHVQTSKKSAAKPKKKKS